MQTPDALRVLCLSIWPPNTAPAIRFRCEAFFPLLRARGIAIDQESFFTPEEYAAVKYVRTLGSIGPIFSGLMRRLAALRSLKRYDVVWLLREAAPVGPPLVEELIARLFRTPIVFDFDDAIWLGQGEGFATKLVRWRSKTAAVICLSSHVMAGNSFLAEFAMRHNPNTTIIPTCVDTESRFNMDHEHGHDGAPVVGWTGSHSTNAYLETLAPVLADGARRGEFEVDVISDRRPHLPFEFRFHPWTAKTEVRDLKAFDVGLMPLGNSPWEQGKCGFKLIQYMALGIPPVASAVGANVEIVRHGVDGFLCRTDEDWRTALRTLASDPAMRTYMGRSGRQRVEEHYSIGSQVDRVADILRGAAHRGKTPSRVGESPLSVSAH